MKRVLFLLCAMLLAAGIAATWWVLRDTPEKVLADGMGRLLDAQTIQSAVLDIAWTSPSTRVTTGIGFAGQVDLRDSVHPRLIGVVSAGEGLLGPEQTADVVLDAGRLAFRPHTVTPAMQDTFLSLVGATSAHPFAVLDTSPFFQSKGYPVLAGHATETRAVISSFPSLVQPAGDWIVNDSTPDAIVTIPFQFDRNSIRPFLIALINAETGKEPDAKTLVGVDRAVEYLLRGTFLLTINRQTREPLTLQAAWPVLDAQHNETLRVRIRLDISGINKPVAIQIPEGVVDITKQLVKPNAPGLPAAAGSSNAVVVPYLPATSTDSGDQFGSYLEDLKANRNRF
jgi:hypothetical protein